jgi:hypothetical protein
MYASPDISPEGKVSTGTIKNVPLETLEKYWIEKYWNERFLIPKSNTTLLTLTEQRERFDTPPISSEGNGAHTIRQLIRESGYEVLGDCTMRPEDQPTCWRDAWLSWRKRNRRRTLEEIEVR